MFCINGVLMDVAVANDSENKIDYSKAPVDFFFAPGVDQGMAVLEYPKWFWRPAKRGKLAAFPASRYPHHNEKTEQIIDRALRGRAFDCAIEFNSVPIVAEDVAFKNNSMSICGKYIVSGAAGARIRNRYAWHSDYNAEQSDAAVEAYFTLLQDDEGPVKPLPVVLDDIEELPFVIDARNMFNFYHFLVETLPRLNIAVQMEHKGPVYIYYKGDEQANFPRRFIDALYPEIADRVEFRQTPGSHPAAISTFSFDGYYYQSPERIMSSFDQHAPDNWMWQKRRPDRQSKRTLDQNSFDTELKALRERALAAIKDMDTSHLPKRFWVTRGNESVRARPMKNEDKMIAALEEIGFECIRFENYTPLEQIALMYNAEVMASHHGAGFANMLFAGPDTHVIEVGTLQTAAGRWSDFMPLCHVSGCHYVCFFADHNWNTPDVEPDFTRDGHIGVALSENGIKDITRYLAGICGVTDFFENRGEMLATANRMKESQSWKQLRTLLESKPALVANDWGLLQHFAHACDALDDPMRTYTALQSMWEMDKTKFRTLEWMIWLTRRLARFDLTPELVREHAKHFPKRHKGFMGKIQWYHRMKIDKPD